MKVRQFGELLAQRLAAAAGLYSSTDENQLDLLRRLVGAGLLPREVADLFHGLRKAGNAAAHSATGDHREALHQLKMARQLGVWFHRTFSDAGFKPGPFVPPPDPVDESKEVQAQLEALRAQLAVHQSAADAAKAAAQAEADRALSAEARAWKAEEERGVWEALAAEAEKAGAQYAEALAKLQASSSSTAAAQAERVEAAIHAAASLELDEADTRKIIDEKLRAAGWEADTATLRHSPGTRPQKGRNLAIAEWPVGGKRADYVLFVGLTPVGIVEAKRDSKDVSADLEQAKDYSRRFAFGADHVLPGGPWGPHRVPFLFSTNGRPYLKQIETKSGIWFLDARRPQNTSRALDGWYTPGGLLELLRQKVDEAQEALREEPTDYLELREYQVAAVKAVETALETGQRLCLLAMATGTGKTRTAIGLVYRLIKSGRFRRILFLVDRTALGEQAQAAFQTTKIESLRSFAEIYDMKGMDDLAPEADTKLHITTIQGMVRRVLAAEGEADMSPVDTYDCIVVDECHRGYLLDRELGETEWSFRSEEDYISKYRRVLEHFDAVKIGLTATPALHTTEIFGRPVFTYGYREAVVDGVLIDHGPPSRIVTVLAEDGMKWLAGSQMAIFDTTKNTVDTVTLPDEMELDVDDFNKRVITENFNRVVCEELARHIDPNLPGKTLIFCVNDSHADLVVTLLKKALASQYGEIEDDAVQKVTGASHHPRALIRRFRNEQNPRIAVTVDLLTTGIDVPSITNLVFIRRVRSRILYEQMLGRATRRCDEIAKESFRIFDAVDLYAKLEPVNTMRPVVVKPDATFADLQGELGKVVDSEAKKALLEQLCAKFHAKRHRLHGPLLDAFELAAGMKPLELAQKLREWGSDEAVAWFVAHPLVAEVLDQTTAGPPRLIISHHPDEIRRVELGYGGGKKPEDCLESFREYLRSSANRLPALVAVLQRPRELTRNALRELRLELDKAGFPESALKAAYRDITNQDVAASIIGFIRQAALGDPLLPYTERVDRAVRQILGRRKLTELQRKWLERIAAQMKVEVIVDRESLNQGGFQAQAGGFQRLNKIFDGKLEELVGELSEETWTIGA